MELTEHLLSLSRQAEEKIGELDGLITRIADVPIIKAQRSTVYSELIASGYSPGGNGDYGHGTAWSACRRMIEQRDALMRLRGEIAAETEILTSIVDDVIGKTGRLI
jgi:hypothetical protein